MAEGLKTDRETRSGNFRAVLSGYLSSCSPGGKIDIASDFFETAEALGLDPVLAKTQNQTRRSVEDRLMEMARENHKLRVAIRRLEADNVELEADKAELVDENAELRADKAELQEELGDLEEHCTEMEVKIADLRDENSYQKADLEADKRLLSGRISHQTKTFTAELSEHEAKYQTLEEGLRGQLRAQFFEILALKKQYEDSAAHADAFESDSIDASSDLIALRALLKEKEELFREFLHSYVNLDPFKWIALLEKQLERDEPDLHQITELLSLIKDDLKSCNDLIRTYKRLLDEGVVIYEPISANMVIRLSLPTVRHLGKDKNICVVNKFADDLPYARTNACRLKELIIDLSKNAIAAMSSEGTLAIGTEMSILDGNNCICISIIDDGAGMDDETRERIFDEFFTTKADSGGSGIGLQTVQQIVKEHHGKIEVESEVGKGTTFRVYLPIYTPPDPNEVESSEDNGRFY